MNADRWEQIQSLLTEAMRLPVDERGAFLDRRCGSDGVLRDEVASLLEASDEARDFFDGLGERFERLADSAANIPAGPDDEPDLIGRRIASFEVTGSLGRGGMGEVYRANDTALGRQVALKVLPSRLAADEHYVARFEQEARALGSLNHENIASIYGVEETDGRKVLVLELVEGSTLGQLVRSGPLPWREALDVARQIAAGLEAAHQRGIVHRDLKPNNIKIAPDDSVKVLDFGIAKLLLSHEQLSVDSGETPVPSTASDERDGVPSSPGPGPVATAVGRVMGTAAYMSPEQARGKHVDTRTDVWSFGCVLFEMLAARSAFGDEDPASTLVRILEHEPDWSVLPRDTPASVRALLERCLCKDVKRRLQAIGEARIIIEDVLADPDGAASAPPVRPGPLGIPARGWGMAGALAVVTALIVALLPRGEPADAPVRRLRLNVNQSAQRVIISPDGDNLAYTVDQQLWIYPLDQTEARRLDTGMRVIGHFWSADSRWIAFYNRGRLWRVSIDGGEPEAICELPAGGGAGAGGFWGSDGRILFSAAGGIMEVAAGGGEPVLRVSNDPATGASLQQPRRFPDGSIVFAAGNRIEAELDGQRTVLIDAGDGFVFDPYYAPSGHLVYRQLEREDGIWAVALELSPLGVVGEPVRLATHVSLFSLAADGTLAQFRRADAPREMVQVDFGGRIEGPIGQPQLGLTHPALADDGRLAVVSSAEGGLRSLWLQDLDSGTATPLTEPRRGSVARYPEFSPDGTRVAYLLDEDGERTLRLRSIDGGEEQNLGPAVIASFSSDGRYLAYSTRDTPGQRAWLHRFDDGETVPLPGPGGQGWDPRISPDGTLIAITSGFTGVDQVYVQTFPGGGERWRQISVEGGSEPRWSRDGQRIFYPHADEMFQVRVDASASPPRFGPPELLFSTVGTGLVVLDYTVRPDADGFVLVRERPSYDREPLASIAVLENWWRELDTDGR